MHTIELSPVYDENDISSPTRMHTSQDVIELIEQERSKIHLNLVKIYHIVVHIFLFSVFESFFFWFYIAEKEENAFKNHFKDVTMMSNLVCLNVNLDLEPLYEYLENEHRTYNNNVPLRFTFVLNGSLFCVISIMNILLKMNSQDIRKINCYILKRDSVILFCLFLYEYLFFQNIIYNYKPKAAMDIKALLFTQC